jgi:hypothetical protein
MPIPSDKPTTADNIPIEAHLGYALRIEEAQQDTVYTQAIAHRPFVGGDAISVSQCTVLFGSDKRVAWGGLPPFPYTLDTGSRCFSSETFCKGASSWQEMLDIVAKQEGSESIHNMLKHLQQIEGWVSFVRANRAAITPA